MKTNSYTGTPQRGLLARSGPTAGAAMLAVGLSLAACSSSTGSGSQASSAPIDHVGALWITQRTTDISALTRTISDASNDVDLVKNESRTSGTDARARAEEGLAWWVFGSGRPRGQSERPLKAASRSSVDAPWGAGCSAA